MRSHVQFSDPEIAEVERVTRRPRTTLDDSTIHFSQNEQRSNSRETFMKSMTHIVVLATIALSSIALEHRVAHAQILNEARCPHAESVTIPAAQARYAWGLWCRDHTLNSPGGTPFSPDHYLTSQSITDHDNAPDDIRPRLFPVFFNYQTMLGWDLPDAPGTDCALLPPTAFNIGLCVAGCYEGSTPLQFADGTMGIKAAAEAGKLNLVTLSPDATLDNLQYTKNQVETYTVDIREDWQVIYTLSMKSGGTLRVTNEHPLLTSDGVMHQAQGLHPGDALVRADGSPDPIVQISSAKVFGKVYNVRPVTTDYVSNIVVAGGYLNGSVRYQNAFLDMVNAVILRRGFTEQSAQLTSN
jgi:hypothetical protein